MAKKVVVIGGGIAGLSAAYFLKQKGFDVRLIEKENRAGGNIKSQLIDGYICESGPNTVLLNTVGLAELLKGTGLLSQVLSPEPKAQKNRFVYKNNKLNKVPTGPLGILLSRLVRLKNKLKLLSIPFRGTYNISANTTAADYVRERLGEDVYDNFVLPFLTGIYAGNPEKLSAQYSLKLLHKAEQDGGLLRGMMKLMKSRAKFKTSYNLPVHLMFTLSGGLQQLPDRIVESLDGSALFNTTVDAVTRDKEGYQLILNVNGQKEEMSTDYIVCAVPASGIDQIIKPNKNLTEALSNLEYVPVKVLHFASNKGDASFITPGFGVLSLPGQGVNFLGILFNSRIFPHVAPDGMDLFTVIVGGSRQPELCDLLENELVDMISAELKKVLQISGDVRHLKTSNWPKAIPQFNVGHERVEKAIKECEHENEGLYFAGNYINGLSVSDCVQYSYELANRISEEA